MPWDTSNRRAELPRDWPVIRRDVLRRDRYQCQIRDEGCTGRASEVDHLRSKLDHTRANLRAACTPCHAKRTAEQGHHAMRTIRAKAKHPVERHPGLNR